MKLKKLSVFFVLFIYLNSCLCFLEYVIVGGAILVGSYFITRLNSCKHDDIPHRLDYLEDLLRRKVFGQPLVIDTVMHALRSHWNKDKNSRPKDKPLVMSFNGGPGIGKNYVTQLMREALYNEEVRKKHVHYFVAGLHFPEKNQVFNYEHLIWRLIEQNVGCPKQLFIFDEVNSMPLGLLNAIKAHIESSKSRGGYLREAIFVFLSNTGTKALNQYAYDLFLAGKRREDQSLKDLRGSIEGDAFNENGEISHTNVIDYYIPFLPLMEPHVKLCIRDEFQKRGHHPSEIDINEILQTIDWGPESVEIFSKSGCKRISQKVALVALN